MASYDGSNFAGCIAGFPLPDIRVLTEIREVWEVLPLLAAFARQKNSSMPRASALFTLLFRFRTRSECPLSALHVEMCVAQHSSYKPIFYSQQRWYNAPKLGPVKALDVFFVT